jgi:two-component system, OmpR family, response regulator
VRRGAASLDYSAGGCRIFGRDAGVGLGEVQRPGGQDGCRHARMACEGAETGEEAIDGCVAIVEPATIRRREPGSDLGGQLLRRTRWQRSDQTLGLLSGYVRIGDWRGGGVYAQSAGCTRGERRLGTAWHRTAGCLGSDRRWHTGSIFEMDRPPEVRVVAPAEPFREAIGNLLKGVNYQVTTATSALPFAGEPLPQIAIVHLPDEDTQRVFSTIADLRRTGGLPIICISRSRLLAVRLAAFAAGADDVMVEPYAPEELLARLAVWVRRGLPSHSRWTVGDLIVDETAQMASRAGHYLQLSRIHFNLLAALARRQGETVSREQLRHEAWGRADVDDNLIDVTVSADRRS